MSELAELLLSPDDVLSTELVDELTCDKLSVAEGVEYFETSDVDVELGLIKFETP